MECTSHFTSLHTSLLRADAISMGSAVSRASAASKEAADVHLVLDDGTAILCHSQILSKHSAVFGNMFSDLAQQEGKVKIPLPEFTEAQCSALLAYLYAFGLTSTGAAFATQRRAHRDAAVAVARFAHTYDAPHVLRQVEAYLTAFVGQFVSKALIAKAGRRGVCSSKDFVELAVIAERFDMPELRGHCERAMVISWELIQDSPDLLDKLSRSTLQRVAKGLNITLLASQKRHPGSAPEYPAVQEVIAWGQHKRPAVQ